MSSLRTTLGTFLAVLLATLAFVLPTMAAPTSVQPVKWLTHFGGKIKADTEMTLNWKGGDGYGWEVFYIPEWPGQKDYYPVDIVANTTSRSIVWRTPPYTAWPQGTTFILGVSDGSNDLSADWYDLTGLLQFEP